MKRLFLAIPLFILLFIFCGEKGEEYFPMGVGSVWKYTGYTLLITSSSTDTIQKFTSDTKADSKGNLDNGLEVTLFVNIETVYVKSPYETTLVEVDTTYIRESGNYILSYESKSDPTPDTVLALPLEKDKTWQVDSTTTAKVLVEENVTVPAGTFKAWKVEQTTQGIPIYYWFAEGTGLVKVNMDYEPISGYRYVMNMELKSANVK